MSDELETLPPVLTASVHDVRYLAALLRGVNFVNRATVVATARGLTISVEEGRTLLGTAYITSEIFDEYSYHQEPSPQHHRVKKKKKNKKRKPLTDLDFSETESESDEESQQGQAQEDEDEEPDNTAFEIPLNTLIECLNIFGTAGSLALGSSESSNANGNGGGGRGRGTRGGWRRERDATNNSDQDEGGGRIEAYFGGSGSEKRTGMRLSYPGAGYPLTLIIAEDASGPTTTCELTTFETEPQLELTFDSTKMVLKIILKSSWLRDALSELDPSCDRLTFVGNPPNVHPATSTANNRQRQQQRQAVKPMFRIQAAGTFGSTEMDYPNDRGVLETFECTKSVSFSYRFGHISRTLRALQHSTKTSLRIDEEGLLSLQFLMPYSKARALGGGSGDGFVEFRCLALDDECRT